MTRVSVLFLAVCSLIQPLAAREFKSADGSKTIEAEFIRYNSITGKVTLRVNNTKNMLLPANSFGDEDQKYFVEAQKEIDMKESVTVKIDRDSRTSREKNDKGEKSSTKNTTFNFIVKNESYATLDGMKLKYWVLVEEKTGKDETMKVDTKEVAVGALEPGAETTISGPTISIKQEKKGGKGGKDKKETSIYGCKYELLSPAGDVVSSDCSSDRVQNYLDR